MTAEKTLLLTNAALLHLRDNSPENVRDILQALKEDAEKNIRNAAAKSVGRLDRMKAMQRIIKSAKADNREVLHGAWIANGKQYVCDGFRIVSIYDPLDLETIPDHVQPIDGERIMPKDGNAGGTVLDLPDVGTLRAYIKTEKARLKAEGNKKRGAVYDFGDGLPAVNAQFLFDMIEIFPDATATASKQRPTLSGIYFNSADGDGILLPVRKEARA